MISVKRFTLLCFLIQVSIGLSYAQSQDQDDSTVKQPDFEINSEENKIATDNGPFFFKINAKRNKAYKLPILETPNYDDFDKKSTWKVYNNEKTSKVVENDKDDDSNNQKEEAVEILEAPDISFNESTSTTISEGDITTPGSTNRMEKLLVEPLHHNTYIYFYKPFDSPNAPDTSSASEKDDTKYDIGMENTAFSSLGHGYPFLENIFSIPSGNIRIKNIPRVHQTSQIQEDDKSHDHKFSSLGFGYPFFNNFHSLSDGRPIKRAVAKVKIFTKGFEDDGRISEPEESLHSSSSIKDEKDKENTKLNSNFHDDIHINKEDENKEKSANVEEFLGSIMPFYNWATSSLFNLDVNRDILNFGNMLRNNYYHVSSAIDSDKKEEHSKPQQPLADILPDVEKKYENDTPEPRSFIEEVMDEINGSSEENREVNIERPPTDKDLPDIESEGSDPKSPKRRSPAECICGFNQGMTNSCSCFPETFVYYQYCSVPVPPTD